MATIDTRSRLLDAAEEIIAERGIDQTSLRQITSAAGANLASVNYHFGSKMGLVAEVFARRLRPINEERLDRLSRAEAAAGVESVRLESILGAFLAPLILLRGEEAGPRFVRLMGRAHIEFSPELQELVFQQFDEVLLCFADAIQRARPDLRPLEIQWRLRYCIGAMAFTVAHAPHLEKIAGHDEVESPEDTLERLVTFLAAGFRAARPTGVES